MNLEHRFKPSFLTIKKANLKRMCYYFAVLLVLNLTLTGCPYRKTYAYKGNVINIDGINIEPKTFYFKEGKEQNSCSVGLKLINLTNKQVEITFSNDYLYNQTDTLRVMKVVFSPGSLTDPNSILMLPPKEDTLISLIFQLNNNITRDNVNLFLADPLLNNTKIVYQRIRK